jgi:Holliday junction resolvasome RuvABC endonuclease subunit
VRTFSVATESGLARAYRQIRIVDAVMPWVLPGSTTIAIVEDVFYSPRNARTSLELQGLHDVLVYEFVRRGVCVGVPTARACKAFATQHGNASKKQMTEAARSLLGVKTANHNEDDGLWLAMMGVAEIGGTLNGWPPDPAPVTVAGSLEKVKWVGGRPDKLERC